jgi:hypothetical protein
MQINSANERLEKLQADIDMHTWFVDSIDQPDAVIEKLEVSKWGLKI